MSTGDTLKISKETKMVDSPGEFVGYSNFASIGVSNDDVIFHFGLRDSQNPQEGKGIAKIYVGLAHAKRISKALSKSLASFEELFGEIIPDPVERLTPEKRKQLEKE